MAFPEKLVGIVYGDGAFGFNGFEFETFVRLDLPVIGVVGNDGVWGNIKTFHAMMYPERVVAADLGRRPYDEVVRGLGGHGEVVTDASELRPAPRPRPGLRAAVARQRAHRGYHADVEQLPAVSEGVRGSGVLVGLEAAPSRYSRDDCTEEENMADKAQGYVDAGGVRTYYEAEGTGDALVLLHGGFSTIETFGGLTPTLAQQYRVYLPERRGHGRTPDVEGPITYEIMAQDTIAFMTAVGLPSAHIVGWSDGALVGLLVALHRPDLVRRLVLIGQPVNQEGLPPEVIEMMKLDKMPDMLPPMLQQMYAAVSPDGPAHWDVVIDKMWQMIRTEPNLDLAELAKVLAPTLIMLGDHDFLTVEHAAAMQRSLPHSQLAVVPGATHGLPVEKPDTVSRLVLDFLGSEAMEVAASDRGSSFESS